MQNVANMVGVYKFTIMEQIIKQHSSILSEVFTSRESYNKHEEECAKYKKEWHEITATMLENDVPIKGFGFNTFCPYLQFFTLDALKPEQWRHNLPENSTYVQFKVNMKERSIEVTHTGVLEFSPADKEKTYLYGITLSRLYKAIGKKWWRKCTWKSEEQLAKKVGAFWDGILETLNEYTSDGKVLIKNIY